MRSASWRWYLSDFFAKREKEKRKRRGSLAFWPAVCYMFFIPLRGRERGEKRSQIDQSVVVSTIIEKGRKGEGKRGTGRPFHDLLVG